MRARVTPGGRRIATGAQACERGVLRIGPRGLAEGIAGAQRPLAAQALERAQRRGIAGGCGGLQITGRVDAQLGGTPASSLPARATLTSALK
jgi:hypothetical protein